MAFIRWLCVLVIGFWILSLSPPALAETRYVTESFEVTLRTGPGIDHKIVAMLQSGQPLTVLSEGEEWTMVELPSGRQGYLLSRFLSNTPPSRIELEKIRKDYEALQSRSAELEAAKTKLSAENQALTDRLRTLSKERETVTAQYEQLKSESSDFFSLKEKYEKAAADLKEKSLRAESMEKEIARLSLNRNIRWFLSGAGVLVLGFIIGFSTKKQRRRSSLL